MYINGTRRRARRRAIRLTIVAAASLLALAACSGGSAGEGAGGSAPAPSAATPGPQARYVRAVVTARGVTTDGAPIVPTSTFQPGLPIYLVCTVRGVAPGTSHRLTIRWYLDGQQPQIDGSYSYATVTQDGPLSFSVIYPGAGAGMARLYWDEPVADNSAQTNEAYLAQSITFTVR